MVTDPFTGVLIALIRKFINIFRHLIRNLKEAPRLKIPSDIGGHLCARAGKISLPGTFLYLFHPFKIQVQALLKKFLIA